MHKPSNAQDYFNLIMSQDDKYAYLASYAISSIPILENEWREFKGCLNPADGKAISEADVSKYWSKALSGFANTAGGVLVWGLDARKDKETRLDCVGNLGLHPDADILRQKLADLLLNAVTPPLRGIEMHAIKKPNSKAGFVVCFIPEGNTKAYRAEQSKQFYMRMSDNFHVPPVAVIRHLFFPQTRPQLVPSVWVSPSNPPYHINFNFYILNEGTTTAEQMFAILKWNKEIYCSVHSFPSVSIKHEMAEHECSPFEIVRYLHPRMRALTFARLIIDGQHNFPKKINFELEICCKDSEPTYWICDILHKYFFKDHSIQFAQKE